MYNYYMYIRLLHLFDSVFSLLQTLLFIKKKSLENYLLNYFLILIFSVYIYIYRDYTREKRDI